MIEVGQYYTDKENSVVICITEIKENKFLFEEIYNPNLYSLRGEIYKEEIEKYIEDGILKREHKYETKLWKTLNG